MEGFQSSGAQTFVALPNGHVVGFRPLRRSEANRNPKSPGHNRHRYRCHHQHGTINIVISSMCGIHLLLPEDLRLTSAERLRRQIETDSPASRHGVSAVCIEGHGQEAPAQGTMASLSWEVELLAHFLSTLSLWVWDSWQSSVGPMLAWQMRWAGALSRTPIKEKT